MNTTTARRTLNRAIVELEHAYGDPEKVRQAAEKGWRAAREAVYAVLIRHGVRGVRGTVTAGYVGDFEAKVLGRPRGRRRGPGQPLTDGYSRAMTVLHGECFYDGRFPADMHREMDMVAELIEQAERDGGGDPKERRKAG